MRTRHLQKKCCIICRLNSDSKIVPCSDEQLKLPLNCALNPPSFLAANFRYSRGLLRFYIHPPICCLVLGDRPLFEVVMMVFNTTSCAQLSCSQSGTQTALFNSRTPRPATGDNFDPANKNRASHPFPTQAARYRCIARVPLAQGTGAGIMSR